MDSFSEMKQFLQKDTRFDVKIIALSEFLGVTGSAEGCNLIMKDPEMLQLLVELLSDDDAIAKTSCLALVNISATTEGAQSVISTIQSKDENVITKLLSKILDKDSTCADAACMILSNLTRPSNLTQRVFDIMDEGGLAADKLVSAFTTIEYNNKSCNLHYLGPVFSNLSQCPGFRRYLLDRERCVIQRLLPFTEFKPSLVRRGGVVGTLRNSCFDSDHHLWLLGDDVDLLPKLLLPLAGPEDLPEDEMDALPPELQYLGEEKRREVDGDVRRMLLEALHQLCATRAARVVLREKNAYVILREYHKWEKDREILLVCENIVDILIKKEEEIGTDNLKEISVPVEYFEKFEKMDKDYIEDV